MWKRRFRCKYMSMSVRIVCELGFRGVCKICASCDALVSSAPAHIRCDAIYKCGYVGFRSHSCSQSLILSSSTIAENAASVHMDSSALPFAIR